MRCNPLRWLAAFFWLFLSAMLTAAIDPRARDLGVPLDGTPREFAAITDVPCVLVGHTTLTDGDGAHAIRTGVTAILPRKELGYYPAATFVLNGDGTVPGHPGFHRLPKPTVNNFPQVVNDACNFDAGIANPCFTMKCSGLVWIRGFQFHVPVNASLPHRSRPSMPAITASSRASVRSWCRIPESSSRSHS